jgi:hypothetical protein
MLLFRKQYMTFNAYYVYKIIRFRKRRLAYLHSLIQKCVKLLFIKSQDRKSTISTYNSIKYKHYKKNILILISPLKNVET